MASTRLSHRELIVSRAAGVGNRTRKTSRGASAKKQRELLFARIYDESKGERRRKKHSSRNVRASPSRPSSFLGGSCSSSRRRSCFCLSRPCCSPSPDPESARNSPDSSGVGTHDQCFFALLLFARLPRPRQRPVDGRGAPGEPLSRLRARCVGVRERERERTRKGEKDACVRERTTQALFRPLPALTSTRNLAQQRPRSPSSAPGSAPSSPPPLLPRPSLPPRRGPCVFFFFKR